MFVLQLRIARGVSELALPKDNARYCNNSPKRNINKKSWTRINQKSLRNCNQLIWLFTSSSIRLLKQKHLKEDQINWLQFLSNVINKHYPKEISSYYSLYKFINILVSVYFDTYITYFIFLLLKAYLLFIAIAVYIELFLDQTSIWDN